ncbi:hypothetical protein ACSLVK_18680 [Photorhabdus tasmaniensis]|uniref:hypothetical protein n=1 Tax=Photorhabdus tasmaniensis TaxID=1004159 RepID=UPI004042D392
MPVDVTGSRDFDLIAGQKTYGLAPHVQFVAAVIKDDRRGCVVHHFLLVTSCTQVPVSLLVTESIKSPAPFAVAGRRRYSGPNRTKTE